MISIYHMTILAAVETTMSGRETGDGGWGGGKCGGTPVTRRDRGGQRW